MVTWLFVGTVYGVGLGITLIGGFVYVLLMGGLHAKVSLYKVLAACAAWPITWGVLAYKIYRETR